MWDVAAAQGQQSTHLRFLVEDNNQCCACPSLLVPTDLRWNNIGLLGGRSLLEALQKNKSIVKLEMAGNNIPSDTLKALGKSVIQAELAWCWKHLDLMTIMWTDLYVDHPVIPVLIIDV